MASTATTRNRLNKQGTGDNQGTWGGVLNSQALDLVDEAMDGVTTLTISGNVTLTSQNYVSDQARRRMIKLTGSPGASYTVTIPSVEKFYFVINQSNAAQTIKAGGIGYSVPAGEARAIACDGTDCYGPSSAVPYVIGAVIDFASTNLPSGWLMCSGGQISRATYAALFGVIGTTYGVGNGTTTFNLPDLRGRVTAGYDSMGGTSANRLTGAYLNGLDGDFMGNTGGLEGHTLVVDEMPSHTHIQNAHTHSQLRMTGTTDPGNLGGDTYNNSDQGGATGSTTAVNQNTGGGLAHNNVQPTMILYKIIYAGV